MVESELKPTSATTSSRKMTLAILITQGPLSRGYFNLVVVYLYGRLKKEDKWRGYCNNLGERK